MKICRFCQKECFVPIPTAAPLALVMKYPRRVTHISGCDAGQEWEMLKFDVCLSVINEAINAAESAEKGSPTHVQDSATDSQTVDAAEATTD